MIEEDRLLSQTVQPGDDVVDRAIRPKTLNDYIGQNSVRSQMEIFIHAAKGRAEALDHTLFYGPPGLKHVLVSSLKPKR